MDNLEFRLGEHITLRKTHPCGGLEWRVERLGADIGIRCLTCGRYLLTPRRKLRRAARTQRAPAPSPATPQQEQEQKRVTPPAAPC